jgi:hypothetical protein
MLCAGLIGKDPAGTILAAHPGAARLKVTIIRYGVTCPPRTVSPSPSLKP